MEPPQTTIKKRRSWTLLAIAFITASQWITNDPEKLKRNLLPTDK